MTGDHSATHSALGYMYQFKYGLVGALARMRQHGAVTVGIELIDDVTFHHDATPLEAIQVKHSINAPAALTDGSPQIWKTLEIWIQGRRTNTLEPDARLYLVTTSLASEGTAAWCVSPLDDSRPTLTPHMPRLGRRTCAASATHERRRRRPPPRRRSRHSPRGLVPHPLRYPSRGRPRELIGGHAHE